MKKFNQRTTHFFVKNIPLTLYSRKGCERVDVGYLWEVSWRWGHTAAYWPKVILTIAALLSHLGWAAQPWITEGPSPLSAAGSQFGILNPTDSDCDWNWTDWFKPSVAPGYIIIWHPPASCGCTASAPNSTTSTGQGDIPISSTGSTCFAVLLLIYTGVSFDWQLGLGSICYTGTLFLLINNFFLFKNFICNSSRW